MRRGTTMKTLIIYFSQTGNTMKVAESIRNGIIEVIAQCELERMAEVDIGSLSEYDLVGFGCPVFYYKEPFNVRDFIENLPELQGKKWFVFCSHGAVMGVTLLSMTEKLEKKGITVIGSHHTYADVTIPFYPYPTVTTGHPDNDDLEKAHAFGKEIALCSIAVANGNTDCIKKPVPVTEEWASNEASMFTIELMTKIMPRLSINKATCTKCGECQNGCPINGIDTESDPPRIQEPCIFCWHCANICPTCSVEADWSMLVEMAPGNYKRYIEALNNAQARGEFRWLIGPDSISYDAPLYQQRERKTKKDYE
ncbi:MAG: EFR1 family ferrodoxin [Thermodesulfobacteriota bacterium]|nr:EFR1 family ferrodoxin [Thermodesulfobacteriota bacterium]